MHISFPPTMSPGYDIGIKTKPVIILKLWHELRGGHQVAAGAHIPALFITSMTRVSKQNVAEQQCSLASILLCIGSVRRPSLPCIPLTSTLHRCYRCSSVAALISQLHGPQGARLAACTSSACPGSPSSSVAHSSLTGAQYDMIVTLHLDLKPGNIFPHV